MSSAVVSLSGMVPMIHHLSAAAGTSMTLDTQHWASNILMNNDINRGKQRKCRTVGKVQIKHIRTSQQSAVGTYFTQKKCLFSAGIVGQRQR